MSWTVDWSGLDMKRVYKQGIGSEVQVNEYKEKVEEFLNEITDFKPENEYGDIYRPKKGEDRGQGKFTVDKDFRVVGYPNRETNVWYATDMGHKDFIPSHILERRAAIWQRLISSDYFTMGYSAYKKEYNTIIRELDDNWEDIMFYNPEYK
ncbi:MAG: hypothetical protein Ta2F_12180 [Termitinemataceae bacterium]|nr:MAG: hypothetical protein Ta2F_12180 [Termitinemataceae bacterium]